MHFFVFLDEHLVDGHGKYIDGCSKFFDFCRRQLTEAVTESQAELFTAFIQDALARVGQCDQITATVFGQAFFIDIMVLHQLIDDRSELLLRHAESLAHARDIGRAFILQQEQYQEMIGWCRCGCLAEEALMQCTESIHEIFG